MKFTTLMVAVTLGPIAASAAPGSATQEDATVSAEQLQETVPVSHLNDADVSGADGETYGDVHDVLLDSDGRVMSLLVRREGDNGSTADVGQTAGSELATVDVDVEDEAAGPSGIVEVPWLNVSYDQLENSVRLSGDMQQISEAGEQPGGMTQAGAVQASAVLDMNVALTDSESYGEVQDILIDTQTGEAAAIVVDTDGFFTSETYAVPFEAAMINEQQQEITLQQAEQDFEEAEEFNLDAITDST